MSDEAREVIEEIARRCARKGLRRKDALALFTALYRADALGATGGNVTRAAEIAGVNREAFSRMRRLSEFDHGASGALDPITFVSTQTTQDLGQGSERELDSNND